MNTKEVASESVVSANAGSSLEPVSQRYLQMAEQLVDVAPNLIYIVDGRGRFCFANKHACKALGYEKEELFGMTYLDLVAPLYRERVKKFYLRQIMKGRQTTYLEFPVVTKDGGELWLGQRVLMLQESPLVGFFAIGSER
jgi:PAS domain S-box-containing protein